MQIIARESSRELYLLLRMLLSSSRLSSVSVSNPHRLSTRKLLLASLLRLMSTKENSLEFHSATMPSNSFSFIYSCEEFLEIDTSSLWVEIRSNSIILSIPTRLS